MKNATVILNQDVYNLGEEGDVCDVAPGYARNYLIPRELAVPYNRENIARFEERRAAIEKRKEEKRDAAKTIRERIESLEITMEMPAGGSGKLFGSVNNQAVTERLRQEGIDVERKKVEIPGHSIKMVGSYEILVKLYADEAAKLQLTVVPEGHAKKEAAKAKAAEAKAKAEAETGTEAETGSGTEAEVGAEAEAEAPVSDSTAEGADVAEAYDAQDVAEDESSEPDE